MRLILGRTWFQDATNRRQYIGGSLIVWLRPKLIDEKLARTAMKKSRWLPQYGRSTIRRTRLGQSCMPLGHRHMSDFNDSPALFPAKNNSRQLT